MNTLSRAKYRAKRIDNGLWVVGYLTQSLSAAQFLIVETHGGFDTTCHKIDKDTVGQFTGLTDKNGFRAFENDTIIDEGGNRSVIKWSDIQAGFYADDGFEEHELAGDWFTVELSK